MSRQRTIRGFTIVELLIVIVVIGILAAIVIVTYNGVQKRAQNASRFEELKAWHNIFEAYRAVNGTYPAEPDGAAFCLGKGFPTGPNGGGVARCRDYDGTDPNYSYREVDNDPLIAELGTIGKLPSFTKYPVDYTVGPYVVFGTVQNTLTMVIDGAPSDCPSGTVNTWSSGNKQLCTIILPNS